MKRMKTQGKQLNLLTINDLKKIIEDSLTHDWVLRVEHTVDSGQENVQWQEWDKALFAITRAEPVIEKIVACRVRHPNQYIRLHAEKFNPRVEFLHCVYKPSGGSLSTCVQQEATEDKPKVKAL